MTIKVTVNQPINIDPVTDVVVVCEGGNTGTFTKYGNQIFSWCADSGIDADLIGHWYNEKYYSAWRISSDEQRMIFVLKWSRN